MAVATDANRKNRLIDGRYMVCPRCREKQDVLRYVPMGMIEEFEIETNPIYKCPKCRWVFSPIATMSELQDMLTQLNKTILENLRDGRASD